MRANGRKQRERVVEVDFVAFNASRLDRKADVAGAEHARLVMNGSASGSGSRSHFDLHLQTLCITFATGGEVFSRCIRYPRHGMKAKFDRLLRDKRTMIAEATLYVVSRELHFHLNMTRMACVVRITD